MARTSSRSAALAAKSKLTETIEEVEENSEEAVKRRRAEEESDFSDLEEGEVEVGEEEEDDHEEEEESNAQTTPTTTSKQKKRKLTFIPPLSHHWIPDRVCASASELSSAINAHNSNTKRRKRHFQTKILDDGKGGRGREEGIVIEERFLCRVRASVIEEGSGASGSSTSGIGNSGNTFTAQSNPSNPPTSTSPRISPTQLSLSLKLSSPPLSVLWCDCSSCLHGPSQLLLLITARQGIHLFRVTVDPERGFTEESLSVGHCAVPFEIDCAALKGGYLCLGSRSGTVMVGNAMAGTAMTGNAMSNTSTTANVYVIKTDALHFSSSFSSSSSAAFTIDHPIPAISLPDTHLTCLTFTPLGLLSGTRCGRLRLHSLNFQERLQLALPSAVPIYCAQLLGDDGKRVVVSGRMSRVLSYWMTEGGDWVTEASSLVALGSAKGSVWMAWPGGGLVKRIFPQVEYWRGGSAGAGAGSGEIEGSETIQVAWSECEGTPALMVVVRGAGELRLMICDEFII